MIALIGFLVVLVGYIFYLGIFSKIEVSENTAIGVKASSHFSADNIYTTSNFMDDFFLSLMLEEGIVTQRGIGAGNRLDPDYVEEYKARQNELADYQLMLEQRIEQNARLKTLSKLNNFKAPERIPRSNRFVITLEKANAYPNLKDYLEANNLPDTLKVMKIIDISKKKTLLILSLEPLG